jgi:hypothetical protein
VRHFGGGFLQETVPISEPSGVQRRRLAAAGYQQLFNTQRGTMPLASCPARLALSTLSRRNAPLIHPGLLEFGYRDGAMHSARSRTEEGGERSRKVKETPPRLPRSELPLIGSDLTEPYLSGLAKTPLELPLPMPFPPPLGPAQLCKCLRILPFAKLWPANSRGGGTCCGRKRSRAAFWPVRCGLLAPGG